ncbi:UreD urease accessory protein-domain-containing protein [Hygrophoropsis aurantiaca]|uniref:UreD urease accessory protein-domain-containing protein n=1 Tax=Hygrophoropsis aurantiaca TaxID=72124 RepID=A0ACB8AGI3_9AGAM|nr:UreD urease accessory protein-domain-containing protein [Hygrophoropsis aurantiaca]
MTTFSVLKKPGTIAAGHGRIVSWLHNSTVVFSELSSTYPLKLLSPRVTDPGVAIVYVMSYGGGLVGGDHVNISVDVGKETKLVLLSQGSTKVFKARPDRRASTPLAPAGVNALPGITTQTLDVTINAQSALFLLPDPVTCFRDACYTQVQNFHLLDDASIILLDWVTSGRKSTGEEWAFTKYRSTNEIFVNSHRIARDILLLEESDPSKPDPRTLKDSLAPYSCYAMLILYGPLTNAVVAHISSQYQAISVYKTSSPPDLLWSLSPIADGMGTVVRIAGIETEDVKKWLRDTLKKLRDIVGDDVYGKAFL